MPGSLEKAKTHATKTKSARPAAVVEARAPSPREDDPKDAPLKDDIRLLGRILGDTVREQQGAEVFDIIERIRLASIRFHRDNEVSARRELAAILDSLDADQTLTIVRAFSYFSHLSNIAEDQHHIRRNRAHVSSARRRVRDRSLTPSTARAKRASTRRRCATSSTTLWSAPC